MIVHQPSPRVGLHAWIMIEWRKAECEKERGKIEHAKRLHKRSLDRFHGRPSHFLAHNRHHRNHVAK